MKIDATVRDAFQRQREVALALRAEVDRDLQQRKQRTWHYESRVKELESFALKVETGRILSLDEVEDVFAATLVVPDFSQVAAAEEVVLDRYEIYERRPPFVEETSKSPDSFRFDDVRLYVRYRRAEFERTPIPDGVLFEVQVKTFLQHAWAVATHDVIYKTPSRDWRRERVAHQVRASLESAEVAIGSIEALSGSDVLPARNLDISELNATIKVLQAHWSDGLLPHDVRRLAENVQRLMQIADNRRNADRARILETLLDNGRTRNAGAHSLDWSPYRSVLNYLAIEYKKPLKERVSRRGPKKLLVYPEVLELLGVDDRMAFGAVIAGS